MTHFHTGQGWAGIITPCHSCLSSLGNATKVSQISQATDIITNFLNSTPFLPVGLPAKRVLPSPILSVTFCPGNNLRQVWPRVTKIGILITLCLLSLGFFWEVNVKGQGHQMSKHVLRLWVIYQTILVRLTPKYKVQLVMDFRSSSTPRSLKVKVKFNLLAIFKPILVIETETKGTSFVSMNDTL